MTHERILVDELDDMLNQIAFHRSRVLRLKEENDLLRARVAALAGALREVEWGDPLRPGGGTCPWCHMQEPQHSHHCALDAALRSGTDAE